jgi:hypothetical protein
MSGLIANLQYCDRDSFLRKYWSYYLILEGKFVHASNYVQIHVDNFNAFSNEFASLQYTIGAELDSFFKVYCGYAPTELAPITDYADKILNGRYNDIVDQELYLREYDIMMKPFEGWDANKAKQSLSWWLAYDNIKHSRYDNLKDAKLKNVLNMLGGLYILEKKYLKELADKTNDVDCPNHESKLFEMQNWITRNVPLDGGIMGDCT